MYVGSHSAAPQPLGEGLYGLSNASLDTPWPKLLKAREHLARRTEGPPADLFEVLADPAQVADSELPVTGVGLTLERLLSSIFIASPTYGTRASTVLITQASGHRILAERSFGPQGVYTGEVMLTLAPGT